LASPDGHVISGRVVDPQDLLPRDAQLLLGGEDGGAFAWAPLQVAKDGSFSTPRLRAGTYILQVRPPHRPHKLSKVVGLALVPLASKDVSGVTVLIQPDTAIVGRFRMSSDDPAAPWPPHIVVQAYVALDGSDLQAPVMADGATGGRFVLRNAFGPRVLRCGYTLTPGGRWWPGRVHGVDITNVPSVRRLPGCPATSFSSRSHGSRRTSGTRRPHWSRPSLSFPMDAV
jgi:hypothetical protein